MVEMTELQGQLTDRGIVLTIGDVLFATGKSNLNASAQRSMVKLAEFLQKKQNRNLLVEGHTDNVGSDDYNQGLSEQRAAAVKSALVQSGIAGDRIVTVGYSKRYPLASNADAAGKQQNRRVEAIILNEGVRPESQFRK
jgi:outer membrane protein OmpA-like peptidoglycan-associated protein